MAITLELPPEEEQSLRRRAQMAGQDITDFLLNAAGLRPEFVPLPIDKWMTLLDELADTAPPDAPLLSDYAVSREGLYEDHD